MYNLYNVTTNHEAIRRFAGAMMDQSVNLEPSIDAYPDRPAPVIRNVEGGAREFAMPIWGMPTPDEHRKPGAPDVGVPNIRNTFAPHWRQWLGVEHRCIVPATSFCEYAPQPDPVTKRKAKVWFALDKTEPLFLFAGTWTSWSGIRGSMKTPRDGTHELFAFLTCQPNGVVAPLHPKAMPSILTNTDEIETWLGADWRDAKTLQRPLPDDKLMIVGRASEPVAQGGLLV